MKKQTFTNRQVRQIYFALNALDGRPDKPGGGAPYKFDEAGKVRYALVKNFRRFLEPFEDTERVRQALQLEFRGEKPEVTESHPKYGEFKQQWDGVLEARVEVEVFEFRFEELEAEANGIPVTVLGFLEPLFTE